MSSKRDRPVTQDDLYRVPRDHVVDFVFDDAVARVFADMIRRSVPGYETVVPITGLIAARHVTAGSRCYDLGCSLGATSLAILRRLERHDCALVAVDNAPAMAERARELLRDDARASVVCADVRDVVFERAAAVVLNYTLQFLPPGDRLPLLRRIREGLLPGGVLIVSEKIRFDNGVEQATAETLHHAFKRANGYSDLEIAQKRTAIENVLITDTLPEHEARLRAAGFGAVTTWFRCLNWASMIAWPAAPPHERDR